MSLPERELMQISRSENVGQVLMVASTASMIKQFNVRNIQILKRAGHEVTVAANFEKPGTINSETAQNFKRFLEQMQVKTVQIGFGRGVGTVRDNMEALRSLDRLFKNNNFEFMHTHSALASVLSRLVAKKHKVPTVYTAHGFQFSKESGKGRWLKYFSIEYVLSFLTNTLIVINEEDFRVAKKFFHQKHLVLLPGIGVKIPELKTNLTRKLISKKFQAEFQLTESDFSLLTVGELSRRKNQSVVFKALAELQNEHVHYFLVGLGPMLEEYRELVSSLGISNQVHFIGYSNDVDYFYEGVDATIFPSKLEGLLTSGVESLAHGKYVIGANVRGIRDLIVDEPVEGILFDQNNLSEVKAAIVEGIKNVKEQAVTSPTRVYEHALRFGADLVDNKMVKVYADVEKEAKG